ncbi:hypothetical protein HS1genome_0561 [Sulfodiicoccus acidiphilus]|uniref:HMA domain-containing protein n=1 Tax=Sulfodiicoccus acidiphilus TaxID=1670455 RepID=A0A348B1X0_9CREN|nr:heavy-metal-associated domain-containing protein [Sulfodiicoccus acidiphilus]BBD72172.1 hypothetical protein HS1genome_0561 [Sulfodiicoccus acidiphilus]
MSEFRAELTVTDVTCDRCARRVEEALKSLEGVREVKVELLPSGRALVSLSLTRELGEDLIREALRNASAGTRHNYTILHYTVVG